jgi:hypothetical protein
MTKHYATPKAFRVALEERLKNISKKEGTDIQRLRRQVAFDRYLCRLFRAYPGDLFLKGGYSMELRVHAARTTKDIDLVLRPKEFRDHESMDQEILEKLQQAASHDLEDFFTFLVGVPTADLEAIPYGGTRFPVEAHMDGRLFVRFPIDVVVSSLILDHVEKLKSRDWLDFAGIKEMTFDTISPEQQFAEKFHAYTLPRDENENSRVKDVVDMLLLIETKKLRTEVLNTSVIKVFEYRKTHSILDELYIPPPGWEPIFSELARECKLNIALYDALPKIAAYLCRPLYIRDYHVLRSTPNSHCHFCGKQAVVMQTPQQDASDTICNHCGIYRAAGKFLALNNKDINPRNWVAWKDYLQSRDKKQKDKCILITTVNFYPPAM